MCQVLNCMLGKNRCVKQIRISVLQELSLQWGEVVGDITGIKCLAHSRPSAEAHPPLCVGGGDQCRNKG